jgi:hypothetical protein
MDPFLAMAAQVLDGSEAERIANENRLRQLTRSVEDKDGEERGFGLMPVSVLAERHNGQCTLKECKALEGSGAHGTPLSGRHQFDLMMDSVRRERMKAGREGRSPKRPPDWQRSVWNLALIVDSFALNEEMAVRNLEQQMTSHPLWKILEPISGVGAKQAARALAAIGDPYIRPEIRRKTGDGDDDFITEPSRPRTVDELKSLCGYGLRQMEDEQNGPYRVAPRREKGKVVDWSPECRKRLYLIATKIVMQLRKPCHAVEGQLWADHVDGCRCSPLRVKYDAARRKLAGTMHTSPCTRCGPKGKPALAGSPLSNAHAHLRAEREVAQALLKKIWKEGRRLHFEMAENDPEQAAPGVTEALAEYRARQEASAWYQAGVTARSGAADQTLAMTS